MNEKSAAYWQEYLATTADAEEKAKRFYETWQERAWAYYASVACELGREPQRDMPMLCERFKVIYP